MSFLLFLRGLIGFLIVFALANYVITQSLWATVVNTLICAALIQLGYFVAILFLVWRSGAPGKGGENASRGEKSPVVAKEGQPAKAAPVPGVGRSPLP
jgi:hypothetical protein